MRALGAGVMPGLARHYQRAHDLVARLLRLAPLLFAAVVLLFAREARALDTHTCGETVQGPVYWVRLVSVVPVAQPKWSFNGEGGGGALMLGLEARIAPSNHPWSKIETTPATFSGVSPSPVCVFQTSTDSSEEFPGGIVQQGANAQRVGTTADLGAGTEVGGQDSLGAFHLFQQDADQSLLVSGLTLPFVDYSLTTAPTPIPSSASKLQPFTDGEGRLAVTTAHPVPNPVVGSTSSGARTILFSAPAGKALYITSLLFSSAAASASVATLTIGTTSSACLIGATVVATIAYPANTPPVAWPMGNQPMRIPPNNSLCVTDIAAVTKAVSASAYVAP